MKHADTTSKRSLLIVVTLILITKFVANTAKRFLYPFAPIISEYLGVSQTKYSYVLAASEFSSLLLPLLGPLSDHFGQKKTLIIAQICMALSMMCAFFKSYIVLVFAVAVAGVGFSMHGPSLQATLCRVVNDFVQSGQTTKTYPELLGRYIGIIEMAWSFSTLFGLTLLALVFNYLSVGAGFLILGLTILPICAAGYFVYPPDISQSHNNQNVKDILRSLWRLAKLVLFPSSEAVYDKLEETATAGQSEEKNEGGAVAISIIMSGLLVTLANVFLFTSIETVDNGLILPASGTWLKEDYGLDVSELGWSLSLAIGLGEFTASLATVFVVERFGAARMIIFGQAICILGYLFLTFLGLVDKPPLGLAMAGLFWCFWGFEFTIVVSFSICVIAVPGAQGTMMSLVVFGFGMGRMLGALVAEPVLWHYGRVLGVGLAGCTAILASTACLLVAFSKSQKLKAELRKSRQKTDDIDVELEYAESLTEESSVVQ